MMENLVQERFRQVLALAAADPEYQALQNRCAELDSRVLDALEKLPPEDRAAVRDYIKTLGTSALRLTEIACAGCGPNSCRQHQNKSQASCGP